MSLLRSYRVGGLITRVIHALPDGGSLVFDSRRQRKRLPPLRFDRSGKRVARAPPDHPWLHLWAVRRLAWWIAILFIIGSACFAVAAAASC